MTEATRGRPPERERPGGSPQDTTDRHLLEQAIALSRHCPPSDTAFSVGALIVVHHRVVSTGFSREEQPHEHAEELAIRRARELSVSIDGATLYSSLEPCATRASGRRACCEYIVEAGIRRVVYACEEPPIFVPGQGAARLRALGLEVVHLADLAAWVREINAHLPWNGTPRDRRTPAMQRRTHDRAG